MNPEKDFSYEASFIPDSGGAYGLIWGAKDASNGFHFLINIKGEYELYLNREGKMSPIKDWAKSPEIKSDKNTLAISKKGDQVIYFINGQKVYQDSYDKLFGRKFGITVIDPVKISVDYMLVKQDINLIPGLTYDSDPENLGDNINTEYSEINPIVTPDGKGLYYARKHSPDNTGGTDDGGDIYYSQFKDGKWQQAKNVGKPLNNKGSNGVCSVTPDGNTILLRNKYTSDGVTLFFSSNGHPGYGSNDVSMTKRLDDSWTKWSEPQNIGRPINAETWDAYYSLSASGEYAYFVSTRKGGFGKDDIYRIKLPKIAKPDPVVLVMGRVLNAKTNLPVKGTIAYNNLADNKLVGIASANPSDGTYKITLPAGKKYGFLAAAENFISVNENLDLTGLTEYKEVQKDLYLAPIEIGQAVRLNNIFFQTAKWDLLPESLFELDRLAKILTDNLGLEIEIDGHTDNVGNDQSNLTLSQNRAKSVLNYLVSKDIKAARLSSNGFGKTKPVAGNDTDEGKQLNRRVEFVILKK
jgi:outer membrane protein OmpA-like peptidoglycan-associated protein